jgi:hypothetical protein
LFPVLDSIDFNKRAFQQEKDPEVAYSQPVHVTFGLEFKHIAFQPILQLIYAPPDSLPQWFR